MDTTTRTKEVAPWNLRQGMKLAPLRYAPGHEPNGNRQAVYVLGTITHVSKGRGYFTGSTVWHVQTDIGEKLMYHGKTRNLPAERVTIYDR